MATKWNSVHFMSINRWWEVPRATAVQCVCKHGDNAKERTILLTGFVAAAVSTR
eukprot:m.356234 g.356234  ORF g.356234 m.356234 type:complete len:54 (-) comp20749_c0_seq3:1897-2058(-)